MMSVHTHPCASCRMAVECHGELVENYDGFPAVICASYHLPDGTTVTAFCDDCLDRLRDDQQRENESPAPSAVSDHSSWASSCAGWSVGVHEKSRIEPNGLWRCRWCWQVLNPPTEADKATNKQRALAAPHHQRLPIRRRW